ncbi:hypothetical protein [Petropleomorpha daqingensis]|uniref:Uncharacterized protein n=1 Tax=Petropleomorpha daqingensis TaxID=2026353 RepID=A0A853CHZ1_9ACTN|nr:hypothetical protein [Petropleomorpha daqingensis]
MSTPDPAAQGRDRADEFLRLLDADDPAAQALLDGLSEIRDLVFLGAGLTGLARALGRSLPPAQRAQASTRQLRLASLRDGSRDDVDGLRTWLRRSGEEVLFLRSLRAAADRAVS